ncbi:MAG: hypothetical protein U1F17_02090 [Burkholderiaceae bacterium]
MATRLALVDLAARCTTDPVRRSPAGAVHAALPHSYLPALLEALSRDDESQAIVALVACAPALRDMAQALARERDPYALLPVALLELLASRLH